MKSSLPRWRRRIALVLLLAVLAALALFYRHRAPVPVGFALSLGGIEIPLADDLTLGRHDLVDLSLEITPASTKATPDDRPPRPLARATQDFQRGRAPRHTHPIALRLAPGDYDVYVRLRFHPLGGREREFGLRKRFAVTRGESSVLIDLRAAPESPRRAPVR